MHLCFIFSPLSAPAHPAAERIVGRNWALDVVRSPQTGPWYPHWAESSDPRAYRFFAGRIAGAPDTSELPAGHAVSVADAASWDFPDGEPDGNWLALKFDRERDLLTATSDLCILQRWFYTQHGNCWYLANSLLFLQQVLGGVLDIEERAAPYIVLFSHLPWHYTPLKNVFSLLSGEVLQVASGEGRVVSRAELPILRPAEIADEPLTEANLAAAAEQILSLVRTGVAAEVADLQSLIVPLSGGMDSRFLMAAALEVVPREAITAITFGLPNSLDHRLGTALARELGLAHRTLEVDHRPFPELLADGFIPAEGIYWSFPTYPPRPLREALPPHALVLSGYLGESVSGSFDLDPRELSGPQTDRRLFEIAVEMTQRVPFDDMRELLADPAWDMLGYEESLQRLSGNFEERYDRWLWANYLLNCGNFELMLHRDRAFYLTPFVHPGLMRLCYQLPRALRTKQRAFFAAMKRGYPDLYAYPTKRNAGFPLEASPLIPNLVRGWRRLRSELDEILWRATGHFTYSHPYLNYADPRESSRVENRAAVLGGLEELDSLSVFNPRGLARLRDRYRRRGTVHPYLIWGLLTVQQWIKHYRSPRRAP